MKTRLIPFALLTLALLSGCVTGCVTPDRARMVCPEITQLGKDATVEILRDNPDARQAFESVAISLQEASRDTTLSFDDLAAILDRLPVEELKTTRARLIASGTLLSIKLLFPDGAEVDVTKQESAFILAGCLADGILAGLP